MSGTGRKEDEVRRMLEGPRPQVPAELAARAEERGVRLPRRRAGAAPASWLLVVTAAVVAFTVWAVVAQPWQAPPAETTPPLEGW